MGNRIFIGIVFAALLLTLLGIPAAAQSPHHRADFSVKVRGITTDLNIFSIPVMPGAKVKLESKGQIDDPAAMYLGEGKYEWTAPNMPGLHPVILRSESSSITLNMFVITPFDSSKATKINGYKIGNYVQTPFRGLRTYTAPRGLIELTSENANVRISPNFTLGEFKSKQQPGHDPTYLLIMPELLIKLEFLLEACREKGWAKNGFVVMSGWRSPSYNAAIGNKTRVSRHLYGGAADIYIDDDRSGQMDDLNGDGKITKADAKLLYDLAVGLSKRKGADWSPGGLSAYSPKPGVRGPFVHIDSRGYVARW